MGWGEKEEVPCIIDIEVVVVGGGGSEERGGKERLRVGVGGRGRTFHAL